jgi:glycerol-3-phosphate cytidylyltransferase
MSAPSLDRAHAGSESLSDPLAGVRLDRALEGGAHRDQDEGITAVDATADGREPCPRVPVGYVSGVFDLFHVGHLRMIRRARLACDVLVVGVLTDAETLRTKGRLPVVPEQERLEIVSSLEGVDDAILDPSVDKTVAWRMRPFDVLFKGDDWRGTEKGRAFERQLATVGARVAYFPYTPHTSSSALRRALEAAC